MTLDSNGVTDLQVLLDTYKKWHVPSHISLAWANWIHFNLNAGSYDLLKGSYSVELILDWSAARISVVVLLPVLLSLAIGLWLNSSAWTDLATIQTAWGTASYVVTAGGCRLSLRANLLLSLTLCSACSFTGYFEYHRGWEAGRCQGFAALST